MGMPKIELRLQMFRGDWDQVWSQLRLLWAMEGLCRINQTHIRQFDEFKTRGLVEKAYPPIYRAGVHYETEKGTEIWPDLPSLLSGVMGTGLYPGPWGDCLPLSTLVLMKDYNFAPIASLKPGDEIMGDGNWTRVLEHAITGDKPILAFDLNNGSTFRCSPEHRLFLMSGEEVRAEDVKPGMLLLTPEGEFPTCSPMRDDRLADDDLAWLVGTYVADGWHEMPRHHRFAISGKDGKPKEEQKRKVKAILEKLDIHTRWHERYIAVNDEVLAARMATYGGHAPEKHLPSLQMSRSQVVAMLQGLKADASVASSGTITHGTTSPTLALQLRVLYRMLGQSVHIKRWDDHGGLGTHPMYRIGVRRTDEEVGNNQYNRRHAARVVAVKEDGEELCADITTDTGRFWLPESDLVVHNCEDLACIRVGEYRELANHYERPMSDATFNQLVAKGYYSHDSKKGKRVEYGDPRFPQPSTAVAGATASVANPWAGWRSVKGGIKAKPYAKWRRGPQGNYHYHALTLLPNGLIEDPSLVLGMGREKEYNDAGLVTKMMDPNYPVVIQYAKAPDVMVVDPEKPSGFAGGKAVALDAKVKELLAKGMTPEGMSVALGDAELGAFLTNEIPLGEGEFDVDAVVGWNRGEGRFEPKTAEHELRRLAGYSEH